MPTSPPPSAVEPARPPKLPPVLDLPPMTPPVTVVGDVHLASELPEVAARFRRFLEGAARRGGTLVLLGDLFDWWVGAEQARRDEFAGSMVEAISGAARAGVGIAFLAGNRDYAFRGVPGLPLDLWPDVVRTRWGSRTVVLSHGDLLCSADRSYLAMRSWLRSQPARGLLRSLPYGVSAYLARGLRDLSERSGRRNAGAHLGIDYGLARHWLAGYEADLLVLGHVHTGVHHRLAGNPVKDVMVLRDWHRRGGVVTWDGERVALLPEDALPSART